MILSTQRFGCEDFEGFCRIWVFLEGLGLGITLIFLL